MCHGLIEKRACTVSVPDLLRAVSYQEPDYDKCVDDYPSVYGSGSDSLLQESSGLSDDALADIIVNDYSSAVKIKFDSEDVDNIEVDALASTGSLSTWFDCIKDDDLCPATDSIPTKSALLVAEVLKDTSNADKVVPKSRKARKPAAVKEQSHAQHDSEMDDETPVLIDEKRKRRMSSNRASAQRSRQRKQERLDELEILTAQLRLENATLSRRAKIAEHLSKKFENEKNDMAKKVEELRQELEAARHSHAQGSPDSGDESKNVKSGICNMVEGGKTPPDALVEFEKSSKNNPENVSVNFNVKKRNISSTDPSRGIFQELYDAIDSDQFDVSIGGEVQDLLQAEWYGSFTECLNA